ncbi:MAG: hypothetical protein JWM62_1007 [Frankiales bacterium]|nr:hypothetical protein [Frankiales bacterium]
MSWLATSSRRQRVAAVLVITVELYFFYRYAENGALFHFWLHLLLGGWVGLGLLTVHRLLTRRGSRVRPWNAGFFGHMYSALPDVLFLAAGLLHATWMDVFALHITAHFLWPNALVMGLVLWTLAVLAHGAAVWGARRLASVALVAGIAFLLLGVSLRAPLPSTLGQLRAQDAAWQQLAGSDWLCTAIPLVDQHGHVAG